MSLLRVLFLGLTLLGLFLNILELFLLSAGKTLCSSQGCKIVDSFARFGNSFMCLLGTFLFLSILVIYLWELKNRNKNLLLDLILIVALTGEGYLIGFQLFGVGHICYFCLTVFLTILGLTLLRFFDKRPIVGLGILGFLSVGFLTFIVPPKGFTPLPKTKYVLIYSPTCPHCRKVEKFLDNKGINYRKVPYKEVLNLLLSMETEKIPVLLVREKNKSLFLIGEEEIYNFFRKKNFFQMPLNWYKPPQGACSLFESKCSSN
jgi:uncharacterized membrane protein/glutaredoxin